MTLHLIEIDLDIKHVVHARHIGDGLDPGYFLHGWLASVFGPTKLQPFRLMERPGGTRLLGYANQDAAALTEAADQFAEPTPRKGVRSIRSKPMPETWRTGSRVGFELRCVPATRAGKDGPSWKKGTERDVYLVAKERNEEAVRELVYRNWVAEQLQRRGGVVLQEFTLRQHRRAQLVRPDHKAKQRRVLTLPEIEAQGVFTITEESDMGALLSAGVGRHRAFGFGLLLLRPPPC
jgi:CRISPR system Cascade subunit CasE